MQLYERHWSDRGFPEGKIYSMWKLKQPLAVSYGTRKKSLSSALFTDVIVESSGIGQQMMLSGWHSIPFKCFGHQKYTLKSAYNAESFNSRTGFASRTLRWGSSAAMGTLSTQTFAFPWPCGSHSDFECSFRIWFCGLVYPHLCFSSVFWGAFPWDT